MPGRDLRIGSESHNRQKEKKKKELEREKVVEGTLGWSTNQTRLQLNALRLLLADHRSTKLSDLEKIDQRYPHHRRACLSNYDGFFRR